MCDYESFWEAINTGELSAAWQILSVNPSIDVNEPHPDSGLYPLHFSTSHQDVALSMLLYMKGANVNVKDSQGQTPLHKAAQTGNHQLVAFLIKAGANASAPDSKGKTPAFYASGSGSMSCTELLIVAESDPQKAKTLAAAQHHQAKDECHSPTTASKHQRKVDERLAKLEDKLAKVKLESSKLREDPERRRSSLEKLEREYLKIEVEIEALKKRAESPSPESKRKSWAAVFGL